jgi:hypothetical protein
MPLRADFIDILNALSFPKLDMARIRSMSDQEIRDNLEGLIETDPEIREGAEVLSKLT